MTRVGAFKAYDIRGRLGRDLDADVARAVGRAFATVRGARRVVVGHDARASSPPLAAALAEGLMAQGVEVLDLGLAGTEEVYFATDHLGADGGIAVTGSHNPIDENGMKLVGPGAAPLPADAGLAAIRDCVAADAFAPEAPGGGTTDAAGTRAAYVARVLGFAAEGLAPLHILVDAGNGAAGPTFDAIAAGLAARSVPLRFTRLRHAPDPAFPNGIPNPMLPENRAATGAAVVAAGADFGVAWDGDFDRCFFFDETGAFVPGEYIVGLLAEAMLARAPGAAIVHDPRVVLATRDAIARAGGRAVAAPTGHIWQKEAMRATGAIYGGEISAHHYFRGFMCCDSGMIPWLLVAQIVSRAKHMVAFESNAPGSLGAILGGRIGAFPSSGEINFRLADPDAAIARVLAASPGAAVDRLDGWSLTFPGWRFNLRRSNTEALVRLNVESRGDAALVARETARIAALLQG